MTEILFARKSEVDTLAGYFTAGILQADHGGTGFGTYVVGDMLYANTTSTLARLAAVGAGQVLASAGVGTAPAWTASPAITNLLVANGGTINFNGGDVLITHSSNFLAITGAASGYGFDSRVIIGNLGTLTIGGLLSSLEVLGQAQANGSMAIGLFSATAAEGPALNFYRSKDAVLGTATVVASGDRLGSMTWYGAQQTGTFATQTAAFQILVEVDGTVTSGAGGDMPGRMRFMATADGSGTPAEAMRIDQSGGLLIGNGTQQQAGNFRKLQVIAADSAALAYIGSINAGFVMQAATTVMNFQVSNAAVSAFVDLAFINSSANLDGNFTAFFIKSSNGFFALGHQSPNFNFSLHGNAAKTLGMERHTTADTAGNSLTISAGSATTGATNKNGGTLTLRPGVSTGSGVSTVTIQAYPGVAAATTDNTPTTAITLAAFNAYVQLTAGTTTIAPLQFASGTNQTTALAGVMEYDGKVFYGTGPANSARGVVGTMHFLSLSANQTGTDVNTAQTWFPGGGATTITLPASTSYYFEGVLNMSRSAGTNAHTISLLFGGSATFSSIRYHVIVTDQNATTSSLSTPQMIDIAVATSTAVTASSANASQYNSIQVTGIMRINGAGTVIPQFIYSAAPGGAPTIQANTWFRLWPVGTNTVLNVGNWS